MESTDSTDSEDGASTGSQRAAPSASERFRERARGWERRLSSRWLGRTLVGSARSSTRIELFDRSMTLAAQLFTSVIPILILLATRMTQKDADQLGEAVAMPEETQSLLEDAVTAAADTVFSVLGLAVVLLSATSLARALTRAFAAIWELPRPQSSVKSGWRWIAVVLAMVLSILVARALTQLMSPLPADLVWPTLVSLCWDVATALFVPWILLSGAVSTRLLLPGALIAALTFVVVRPLAAVWLPMALESSADRYGVIGVTFTYLALLYFVSFCFLATAILGQVIATDPGRLGDWIRGDSGAASEN